MSLVQSTYFASASATGKDWRDTSKTLLEQLEGAKTQSPNFNFGFLYITDQLSQDASSIVNLFSSVLSIKNWVGSVGIGICSTRQAYVDESAISAMIGYFDPDDFCMFGGANDDYAMEQWLQKNEPMLVYAHANPLAEQDPIQTIQTLEAQTRGFVLGGLSSSRHEHAQFCGNGGVSEKNISGAVFSQNVKLASAMSQGCLPISSAHIITRASENTIYELDERQALEVFEDDLRTMAIKKIDRDPDEIIVDEGMIERGEIPEELQAVFKGEVLAAFPVAGSDQNDYLVRNLAGFDPEDFTIAVNHPVTNGQAIMFVHRNDQTVLEDLRKNLVALKARITKDTGRFEPKAGLYISCAARAFGESEDTGAAGEISLIREIIGDIPLTGFYASGEINKGQIYGYTGILTLFL